MSLISERRCVFSTGSKVDTVAVLGGHAHIRVQKTRVDSDIASESAELVDKKILLKKRGKCS